MRRTLRTRVGVRAGQLAGWLSRVTGRGAGATVSGRVLNAVAPGALAQLAEGRQTALVSATNGKTTTTRFLAAAVAADGRASRGADRRWTFVPPDRFSTPPDEA